MGRQQVADRVRAGQHRLKRGCPYQQRHQRDHFDGQHQHQRPQHCLGDPTPATFHVFGQQHGAAITVEREQRSAHRTNHQRPGRRVQYPVIEYQRADKAADRLLGVAKAQHHDHHQCRHLKEQANAGDPRVQLDVENAKQIAQCHNHQGHRLPVKLGAERCIQVSGCPRGQDRWNEHQHSQHGKERSVTGHPAKYPLGKHVFTPCRTVRPAQFGIAKRKHQRQHTT
ncbi:hypothetical protein D3C81_1375540 [compost metagenome]